LATASSNGSLQFWGVSEAISLSQQE